ncbi:MAG: UDP-N-acetylmuramoyl-tripeptide--D-alanyl-D-alanine ligase [Peptococcaceae bacterium]
MLDLTLQNLAKLLGARYQGATNIIPKGVAIDSRNVRPGDLFFALQGENTDGHHFVDKAFANGAVGAVINNIGLISMVDSKNLLICEDPLRFLQDLAKLVRQNVNIPVIAVTGSTGKTTTKDLVYSVLKEEFITLKTQGNYNNELGLPVTLCSITKEHTAVVLEMGMRGLGQIAFLCELAKPTQGIITNIGLVHAELLGSQEEIARAKAELLSFIPAGGAVFLNSNDQELLGNLSAACQGRIIWYGLDDRADIYAENVQVSEQGSSFSVVWAGESCPIELKIPGEHNIQNALAAVGVGRSLGVSWESIKKGLAAAELTSMRLQIEMNSRGVKIIDDTYNANPAAMKAALQVLAEIDGKRKTAVLGDMYELGSYEEQSHKEIGAAVVDEKINRLVAVGELGRLIGLGALEAGMKEESVCFAPSNEEALNYLENFLEEGDTVLIKGSRGMKMESIVKGLMR